MALGGCTEKLDTRTKIVLPFIITVLWIVKVETSQEIVFNLTSSNLVSDASAYDVTGDGVVNILDLVFVAARLGDADTEADVNADGTVNILDLVLISQNLSD